jgi:radical SAM superfamily enzyme YgiQ (UPF0313 family)
MRVCLISPPTVTEFGDRMVAEFEALNLIAQHAPMGILSLAAVLEQNGVETEIIDLNRLYHKYIHSHESQCGTDFCAFASDALAPVVADVFGFSTICSSYPLTLRLARAVRARHPDAWIILGGPQASVVDRATLQTFPDVDLIVRGEAEETFPIILESLSNDARKLGLIDGVTFRQGTEIIRRPNAPVIEDLDSLPPPAFHLYPHIKDCCYAPVEAGRGCPFACSFCSTNDFFRRRFRMKSPQVLVSQMELIKKTYGIESFDLIHDMFTVDRKKVLAFCDAVEQSGGNLYWSCSARTDCVDDELISRMAKAGCDGVFFGIDTGSEAMQEVIQKRLDMNQAALMVKSANHHGIKTTVSLITGFPEETKDDLRATIRFLGDSLRYEGSDIQLHLLCPLAETPITSKYRDRLTYDDIFSDISFQGWEQDPKEREMIKSHRDLFPNFYGLPTEWLDRQYLRELREFLLHGILRHLWLMVLLHRDSNDLVSVFDEWQIWSFKERRIASVLDASRGYYSSDAFSRDLLRFVQTHYSPVIGRYPHLLGTMARVEEIQLRLLKIQTEGNQRFTRRRCVIESMETVPILARDAHLTVVSADYKKLIRSLKRNTRLDLIREEPVALVLMRERDNIKTIQLSRPSYELVSLCDGLRNVLQISDELSILRELDVSPQKASIFGLTSLAQKGLIEVRNAAR